MSDWSGDKEKKYFFLQSETLEKTVLKADLALQCFILRFVLIYNTFIIQYLMKFRLLSTLFTLSMNIDIKKILQVKHDLFMFEERCLLNTCYYSLVHNMIYSEISNAIS